MNQPSTTGADLIADETRTYLSSRLDGARSLYLLALALGERKGDAKRSNSSGKSSQSGAFGRMIREARIHFAGVLEEARLAGLDTSSIADMLSRSSVAETLRPEMRGWVDELLAAHTE